MFTGLIEEIGTVKAIDIDGSGARLTISCKKILDDVKIGDSIAVNGCCLTVVEYGSDYFKADVSIESLKRTQLGDLKAYHSRVHLERAMPANGRFGGHILSGHVDTTGWVSGKTWEGNALLFSIDFPAEYRANVIPKGSIGIQGTSLTIARLEGQTVTIALIPHTLKETLFEELELQDRVNLEFDIVGKYIQRLFTTEKEAQEEPASSSDASTYALLEKSGYFN